MLAFVEEKGRIEMRKTNVSKLQFFNKNKVNLFITIITQIIIPSLICFTSFFDYDGY